jgi:hypothetical protein
MTDYTTIRVTKDAKAEAEQSKRDGETWNEYLQRCTENPPEVREFVDADAVAGEDIADAVVADLRASLPADVAEELATELR